MVEIKKFKYQTHEEREKAYGKYSGNRERWLAAGCGVITIGNPTSWRAYGPDDVLENTAYFEYDDREWDSLYSQYKPDKWKIAKAKAMEKYGRDDDPVVIAEYIRDNPSEYSG